jgi:hypothetical protein
MVACMILHHLRKERTLGDFNNLHNIAQSQKPISIKDLIIEVNKRIVEKNWDTLSDIESIELLCPGDGYELCDKGKVK